MAASMLFGCSKGGGCTCATFEHKSTRGSYKWHSDAQQAIPPAKVEYAANVKFAVAVIYCAIQKVQAEQFLSALQLCPRSRPATDGMAHTVVANDIMEEKWKVEADNFEALRCMSGLVPSNDTGHNHSRGSTIATNATAVNNRIISTLVDTTTPAAKKEGVLVDKFLHQYIKEQKLDLAGVAIDKNLSNAKKIRRYTR
jgi:hypothetical protein